MGYNQSKAINSVRSGVEMSVDMALQSTASCNTTVSGANIISIVGGRNIDISNIRQKMFLKMDSSCTITQLNSASVKQQMDVIMKQKAESVTSGLGMNAAAAKNFIDTMLRMPVQIQNSLVASMNASTTGTNLISVQGTDGATINVVDQDLTIETVTKTVIDQTMNGSVAQDLKMQIDQAAKATAKGLDLTIGLIVFIVLAIVGGVVLMSWKNTAATVLMSPLTWVLVLTPVLIASTTLFFAGLPAKKIFWPYDLKDTKEAGAKNKMIMLASGVTTATLLIVESVMVYAVLTAKPKAPAPANAKPEGLRALFMRKK